MKKKSKTSTKKGRLYDSEAEDRSIQSGAEDKVQAPAKSSKTIQKVEKRTTRGVKLGNMNENALAKKSAIV
jgi:hypothetical protein